MTDEIIQLIHKHGVRGLVNLIADICDEYAEADNLLPYNNGEFIDSSDLFIVANNLRNDLY